MINSMTGYGEAQGEVNGVNYVVEIKTLNNRYFKTIIRLPELAAFLEEDIDKLLRKNLSRGTINYVLRLKDTSAITLFDINETALQAVVEKLSRAASSASVKGTVDVGNLLNLPGIIQPTTPDEQTARKIKEAIVELTNEAIERLKQMRAREGEMLAAEFASNCEQMRSSLEKINQRTGAVVKQYHDKLKKRVDELLAGAKLKIDEEFLAREVAIHADRSDIA